MTTRSGTDISVHRASLPGLRLAGEVFAPGEDGYADSAAALFAAGTPDLVVRPGGEAGVTEALRYAAGAGLAVSVRAGGHSMAGLSTHADGLLIDLRRLGDVRILDRETRLVRVGAGATWGAVSDALQPHGLALTAGDTRSVGVGGLTLGGGIGWLARRHGLAIDSVAGADLVTADGHVVRADAASHGELFWALRGGGGNFGVVTSFDFIAQPVTTVTFETLRYGLDGSPGGLERIIAGWRDLMRDSDENLTTALAVLPSIPGKPTALLRCCYAGPDETAAIAALAPFRELAPVSGDEIRTLPYARVLEDAHQMPPGLRVEMRSAFFRELDDHSVAAVGDLVRGGGVAVELRSLGGAVGRVPSDATAFAHRDAEVLLTAGIMLPASAPPDQAVQALSRWDPVADRGTGAYVNFLGTATAADVAACYPPAAYQRLAAVKRRYDPGNVFRRNHNIHPGTPET